MFLSIASRNRTLGPRFLLLPTGPLQCNFGISHHRLAFVLYEISLAHLGSKMRCRGLWLQRGAILVEVPEVSPLCLAVGIGWTPTGLLHSPSPDLHSLDFSFWVRVHAFLHSQPTPSAALPTHAGDHCWDSLASPDIGIHAFLQVSC